MSATPLTDAEAVACRRIGAGAQLMDRIEGKTRMSAGVAFEERGEQAVKGPGYAVRVCVVQEAG